MSENALILNAPNAAEFKAALIMGQGLPAEVKGQPAKYFWKEMLVPGRYIDANHKPFVIDDKRVDNLILNFRKASLKGFRPAVLTSHDGKTASDTLGAIIDMRKNARGGLEGLHQMIGEDAHKAVARNGSSICTLKDVVDEHGEKYDELVDHNAVIPNPRLTGLQDFQPAIAASRGQVAQAVVLTLAANTEEPNMALIDDIKKALGTPDLADDKLVTRIGELAKAEGDLKLSRDAHEKDKTALADANTKLGTATTELQLARKQPDAEVLADRLDVFNSKVDVRVERGLLTPAQATEAKKLVLDGDKPSSLMLSRTGTGPYRYEPVLGLIDLLTGDKSKLPGPTGKSNLYLSRERQAPGDEDAESQKAIDAEAKEAEAWRDRELAARGLKAGA